MKRLVALNKKEILMTSGGCSCKCKYNSATHTTWAANVEACKKVCSDLASLSGNSWTYDSCGTSFTIEVENKDEVEKILKSIGQKEKKEDL